MKNKILLDHLSAERLKKLAALKMFVVIWKPNLTLAELIEQIILQLIKILPLFEP